MLKKFCFGDDSTTPVCQVLNHSVFHSGQKYSATIAPHGAVNGIDFKRAHTNGGGALPFPPTDQCLHSRDKFAEIERFAHIVIRTRIKDSNHRFLVITRREYQDRNGGSARAKTMQYDLAIEFGKHQVENHKVVRV